MTTTPRFRERATALVIRGNEILLVQHAKNGLEYYLLPGGGIEVGETTEAAVCREVREETGLTAVVGRCVYITDSFSPDQKRHIRQRVHLCEVSGTIGPSVDEMVATALWVHRDAFKSLTFYPNIRNLILQAWDSGFPNTPFQVTVPWE